MSVTIYHNPRCSKSRQTLKLLEEKGVEPEVVAYLTNPPSVGELALILEKLGMEAKDLLRVKDYRELGLVMPETRHELIKQIVANPAVIERPIVVCGDQARIGRPPEQVLEIMRKIDGVVNVRLIG